MIIQNNTQYQAITHAAGISMSILRQMYEMCEVGVFPSDIDIKAAELCREHGVKPAFLGVKGHKTPYAYSSCIFVNEVAVHGIPSSDRAITSGDVVKLDFGIIADSYYTDHCVTVGVGQLSAVKHKLLQVGRDAVLAGVAQAVAGKRIGDIGHAIESTARRSGFDTIKYYIGHGIGHTLHDSPEVPASGKPGTGQELIEGMVLCIEAQVVAGSSEIWMEEDGWTVRTKDGKPSVMFEYMVIVRKGEPEILTDTRGWKLVKS